MRAFLGKAFEKGCLSFVSSLKETVAEPRKKQTFYTFIHFYVQIILASLVVLHSESGGCFKQFLDVLKPQVGETIRFGSDHVLKWGGQTTATFQSPCHCHLLGNIGGATPCDALGLEDEFLFGNANVSLCKWLLRSNLRGDFFCH